MDGTGEHYAKWNKPGGEGQILYDLTFNWNIINKRKKQTKYNQSFQSTGRSSSHWATPARAKEIFLMFNLI